MTEGSNGSTPPEASPPSGVPTEVGLTRPRAAAPPASPLRSGDVLAGRYRIVGFLGAGGMGAVYEAEDVELGIAVALKTIRGEAAREERALRALKREVLLARQVTHRNVCRLYHLERDVDRDLFFCTMELLRGETLQHRMEATGALWPESVLPLARQMATGLDAAHAAGVVHRDFKPGNVILVPSPDGERAVVTDFGLALSVPERSASRVSIGSGEIAGTPAYMAPEQMRGEPAGPEADVYAFGVVLFELMTGTLPFEGGDGWAAAERKLREDAPSAAGLVPDLSGLWNETIGRCLRRDPRERFTSVRDVARVLAGEMSSEVASVRPRGRVPAERDAFVGRASDLLAIERKLDGGTCLLTLLGPAGTGKTRLAIGSDLGSALAKLRKTLEAPTSGSSPSSDARPPRE